MKLVKTKCTNCGAVVKVNSELDNVKCNYCGAELYIDDEASELKRLENVKLAARKANYEQDMLEEKERKKREAIEKYTNGWRSKVMAILIFISIILIPTVPGILSKILVSIELVLYICAWLMGMGIIKEPFNGIRKVLLVIGVVLLIAAVETSEEDHKEYVKYNWSDFVLGEKIPKLEGKKVDISTNTGKKLDVDFDNIDVSEYKDYEKRVRDLGYTIEGETNYHGYEAFNKDGYKIDIYYYESSEKLLLTLDAPIKLNEIEWPTVGLITTLPTIKSNLGSISADTPTSFRAYVGNMSLESFEKFANECRTKGYDVDYRKYDKSFSAQNKDRYSLRVEYEGNNIMGIYLYVPSK